MLASYKKYFIWLVFAFAFLAPSNNLYYYIQASFPLILVLISKKSISKPNIFILLLLITIFISYILAYQSNNIPLKSISRIFFLSIMLFFFPFVKNANLSIHLILFLLVIILLSQLAFVLNITSLKTIIDQFYLPEDDLHYSIEKISSVSDFNKDFSILRFGGLFMNPNQCARYTTLLFAIFIIVYKAEKGPIFVFFMVLFFISIFLTGSRSGLIVFSLIFLYDFITKSIKGKGRIMNIAITIFFLIFVIYFFKNTDSRNIELEEGYEKSMDVKMNIFSYYLDIITSPSVPQTGGLLFGNFSMELSSEFEVNTFDSEIGNLFFVFGLLGTGFIFFFFRNIYLSAKKNSRIVLILLFWMISSSVLFSFRMSFLFLFVLSNYYSADIQKTLFKKNNNT